jgi:hypothetical protein
MLTAWSRLKDKNVDLLDGASGHASWGFVMFCFAAEMITSRVLKGFEN